MKTVLLVLFVLFGTFVLLPKGNKLLGSFKKNDHVTWSTHGEQGVFYTHSWDREQDIHAHVFLRL